MFDTEQQENDISKRLSPCVETENDTCFAAAVALSASGASGAGPDALPPARRAARSSTLASSLGCAALTGRCGGS